jgi:DNA-binding GntR family transcriptional regulator
MPRTGARSTKARPRAAKRTGSQVVYEALRCAIISLGVEPGSMLDEIGLCRQYKVSRTPVREALIRLSAEGLVQLEPNRGARVATLQFIDIIDHYEAMEVFQPITCHFAAVRSLPADIEAIKTQLAKFCQAVESHDDEGSIRFNYELHSSIASASHNRCIERGYRQMLADKLRIAQTGLPSASRNPGATIAKHFEGTLQITCRLVDAIARHAALEAERIARDLNEYVRGQVIAHFSVDLARRITLPTPRHRTEASGSTAIASTAAAE